MIERELNKAERNETEALFAIAEGLRKIALSIDGVAFIGILFLIFKDMG